MAEPQSGLASRLVVLNSRHLRKGDEAVGKVFSHTVDGILMHLYGGEFGNAHSFIYLLNPEIPPVGIHPIIICAHIRLAYE